MSIRYSFLLLILAAINSPVFSSTDISPETPFNNRIIFSETPEIGTKWHPGILNTDILCWDFFWNINNWFSVDLLNAGLSNRTIVDGETGDTTRWTDNFSLVTLKSRPMVFDLFKNPYKVAVGITVYRTIFEFFDRATLSGLPSDTFSQGGLFITQSWYLKDRRWWFFNGSHYFNLLASYQVHPIHRNSSLNAWYIIPGYRFLFNRPHNLSFDFEYYIMNPYELPIKTFQILTDPDQLPFENPNLYFVSFMFWGFSYSWKHAHVELHIGHHYSFTGPIIPMLGFGWDF